MGAGLMPRHADRRRRRTGPGRPGQLCRAPARLPARTRARVATQTLREARNRNEFLLKGADPLGHPIEVIAGPRGSTLDLCRRVSPAALSQTTAGDRHWRPPTEMILGTAPTRARRVLPDRQRQPDHALFCRRQAHGRSLPRRADLPRAPNWKRRSTSSRPVLGRGAGRLGQRWARSRRCCCRPG